MTANQERGKELWLRRFNRAAVREGWPIHRVLVLREVADEARDDGSHALRTVGGIVTATGLSDSTVKRELRWARTNGWLTQRERGGRRGSVNRASVHDLGPELVEHSTPNGSAPRGDETCWNGEREHPNGSSNRSAPRGDETCWDHPKGSPRGLQGVLAERKPEPPLVPVPTDDVGKLDAGTVQRIPQVAERYQLDDQTARQLVELAAADPDTTYPVARLLQSPGYARHKLDQLAAAAHDELTTKLDELMGPQPDPVDEADELWHWRRRRAQLREQLQAQAVSS